MIDDDDDSFLYGDSQDVPEVTKPPVPTSVPQPISLEQARSASQGLVANLEAAVSVTVNGDTAQENQREDQNDEGEGEEEEEEEEESEDDIEIIMEPTARSLDFRNQTGRAPADRSTRAATPTRAPAAPRPSLTTEYTPRERGGVTKLSSTPQPAGTMPPSALPATSGTTTNQRAAEGEQQGAEAGPDTSTLPPATAPPSHPTINPAIPGTLDGRSILEVDLAALAEKPWRRPGSDLSDWFNYGFDEMSWEAYCYRRRELGEVAGVLKANVLNFAGMPEEQLTALPPEIRTMVVAGATAMMASGGAGPNGGGMMAPGAGMNMNGSALMNQMMNMGSMMNPMMQDMGMGVGGGMGMNGEMGMGMGGPGPGMQMSAGGQGMGGGGPGQGMMQEGAGPGVGIGGGPQGAGQGASEGQMGMGEAFGPGITGPGQGMMGMGMGGEFAMQQQEQSNMGQQMYPGMESSSSSTPVAAPTPTRGGAAPGQFRGRVVPSQPMGPRGRTAYAPRGRVPVRPASPLPPNVPTGPRNKNKYKDIDGSAPAVEGLDYGGGGGMKESGGGTPDHDERERSNSSRKRRSSPSMDDSRGSKRR
ncbi:Fip1-domain-containing protein [Laetiporus sulphureus 93-53]|uniref:Fip1-domain-containing protein n=1 Tax=Laetiporus sulphureus 93-53 TaxID=1314785 RepID=A0A165FCV7_9APHY|nr:Fip1-domain-containing protein [Laetiporus sulphureus 93-53]KZT08777.1 Fip1-domain-containing protein [Laetiporus sulphureus 93-53]